MLALEFVPLLSPQRTYLALVEVSWCGVFVPWEVQAKSKTGQPHIQTLKHTQDLQPSLILGKEINHSCLFSYGKVTARKQTF